MCCASAVLNPFPCLFIQDRTAEIIHVCLSSLGKKMLPTCLGREEMGGERRLKIEEGMTEAEMDGWSERARQKRACVGQRETCQNLASSLPRQLLLAFRSFSGQFVWMCVLACLRTERPAISNPTLNSWQQF